MDIGLILQGWANLSLDKFNLLDKETKQLSEKRLKICHSCSMRTKNSCDPNKKGVNVKTGEEVYGCGCNISASAMTPNKECPKSLW